MLDRREKRLRGRWMGETVRGVRDMERKLEERIEYGKRERE